MKSTGKLAVIEFHKQQTPMGSPVAHDISKAEVIGVYNEYGFSYSKEFHLYDNFNYVVLSA